MKLNANKQELEEYFAKKYTEKYVEFGGYFHIPKYRTLNKSPMEQYFSSGKYKELNDPVLERYWKGIRKREFFRNIIMLVIIISFYVLN
ncbi:MAG: hypothetical protein KAT25_07465 [Sulfuriflexus sp.]|nr:hypothetical protein [Sulfuriflexus sp.]